MSTPQTAVVPSSSSDASNREPAHHQTPPKDQRLAEIKDGTEMNSSQHLNSPSRQRRMSSVGALSPDDEQWTVIDRLEMVADHAFEDWKKQRAAERTAAKQKQHSPEKVPVKLSSKLQVWVPIELMSVVQSLWARAQQQQPEESADQEENFLAHEIRIWALFLRTVHQTKPNSASSQDSQSLTPASRTYLLRIAFAEFVSALNGNDVHAVLADLHKNDETPTEMHKILQCYSAVQSELIPSGYSSDITIATAGISSSEPGNVGLFGMVKRGVGALFALFGGQGVNWLQELRTNYHVYVDVRPTIERAIDALKKQATLLILEKEEESGPIGGSSGADSGASTKGYNELFGYGLDIVEWIQDDSSTPPSTYLSSAPLSYPMIGLTALINYLICIKTWGLAPSDVVSYFKGVTGHSQGILSALIFAASKTEKELIENIISSVEYLFWIGVRLQQAVTFPSFIEAQRTDILKESKKIHGSRNPTPMMVVLHLLPQVVQKYVDIINKKLSDEPNRRLEIAIQNGPRAVVVVGHPESLHSLSMLLNEKETRKDDNLDQSRVPHSKRKREFRLVYLPVSVPFHSQLLKGAVQWVREDVKRLREKGGRLWSLRGADLAVPLYSTLDGTDLRATSRDLVDVLIDLQCTEHVDWLKATEKISRRSQGITHVIDFGPGKMSGAVSFTSRNLEGSGVQFVMAGAFQPFRENDLVVADKSVLFDSRQEAIPYARDWQTEFGPRLVCRKVDNKLIVDTKYSRVVGKPPVMVAGMTPTSASHQIVAATLNAGYHGELAGGGLPTQDIFRQRVDQLVQSMDEGHGITLNLLFLNPRQWNMQFPLLLKLKKQGYPIEGVCIAAGVPSLEKSAEVIDSLERAGIRHVAFKPGSIAAIRLVCEIAAAHPHTNILLQWTGGRAGGHHSFEDFHEPILQTYSLIRSHSNIVLLGGSGFGDAEHSWPYLNGSWSIKFGYQPMPYDAILLGSRMMVAKEANTSLEAKKLLVETKGIDNEDEWEHSYHASAGGIVTVKSELGEPIHKVLTRGLEVWKDFDDQFFSLTPKEKMVQKIVEKKQYIINRLNADFQKVYFGRTLSGRVVDLPEMTYYEVAHRMVSLMYIQPTAERKEGRWIDKGFFDRVLDFSRHTEERFITRGGGDSGSKSETKYVSALPAASLLKQQPFEWVDKVFKETYPDASVQLLSTEDVDYFIQLCKRRIGKPVNFVPVIDEHLQFWFKKDSLWQSEDLDAVPDRDVGRVVILQGPLAVRYCTKVNEPVADILNGIHDGWVDLLMKSAAAQRIPKIEYLSPPVPTHVLNSFANVERSVRVSVNSESSSEGKNTDKSLSVTVTIRLPQEKSQLPDRSAWYEWLCAGSNSWWRAVLTSPHLAQGKKYVTNPFVRLLDPTIGQRYEITSQSGQWQEDITEVSLFDDMMGQSGNGGSAAFVTASLKHKPILHIKRTADGRGFSVTIYHSVPISSTPTSSLRWETVPLTLHYRYHADRASAPISQVIEGFNDAVKQFYGRLWFSSADEVSKEMVSKEPLTATFTNTYEIKKQGIDFFSAAIGRSLANDGKLLQAPTDFAIVAAWESLIKSLFLKAIGGNLLHLVHLNNGFRKLSDTAQTFTEGDAVVTKMEIIRMHQTVSGLQIGVVGQLKKQPTSAAESATPLIEIRSEFLFRGNEAPVLQSNSGDDSALPGFMFEKTKDTYTLEIKSNELLAILKSKEWIRWRSEEDNASLKLGERLFFKFNSLEIERNAVPAIDKKDEFDFPIEDDESSEVSSGTRKRIKVEGTIYKLSGPSSFVPTPASLDSRGDELEREMMDAVACISYEKEQVNGNVIRAFVQRFGKPLEHAVFFENGGYQLLNVPDRAVVPAESLTYALASGDLNPIHTNRYFSIFADLPHDTITHGMWTSANARRVIESFVAKNRAERVVDFHTEFVGMVKPRDQLSTSVRHVGMRNGRMLVEIETTTDHGELVLKGTADVKGPRTCYVFTGQGSVSVGMGLDLYSSSAIAKKIWDAADNYFQEEYGFSILQLVKENPKEITIFFGGRRGKKIKKNYRKLTCQVQEEVEVPVEADQSEGEGKKTTRIMRTREKPVFPDINDTSSSYTFKHPEGLLFATQFSQPALVLVELSAFEDMHERGLIPSDDCIFAGHSLGEYAALASVAKVLTIESLVDIVFLRGMTMQNSVIRDKDGHSQYSMVAVNPQRVHPFLFRDVHLDEIIAMICQKNDQLLQVVNYNVEHYQYVVAGENGNLNTLGLVLDEIHQRLKAFQPPLGTGGTTGTAMDLAKKMKVDRELIEKLVDSAMRDTEENVRDPVTRRVVLKRGVATIPLPGIDVPFHSKFLKDGVPAFRQILLQRMCAQQLNPSILVGRYIPNVTAVPFSLGKAYVEAIRDQTQSPILSQVLDEFEDWRQHPQKLAFQILVELLAYQFASPVRWIETQKVIFAQFGVERLIEIGPAPTLSQMAKTTLALGNYSPLIKRENLWYNRDRDIIYFNKEDVPNAPSEPTPAPSTASSSDTKANAAPAPPTAPIPSPSPPAQQASSAPVADEKPTALESLLTLLSIKLQKEIGTIAATASVKSLTGGKSALQNEIVGDLQKEFEKEPEGAAEMEISTLAAKLADGPDGGHKLGSYLNGQIAKLISGKMPGGFPLSSVKGYLVSRYGLGEGRIEGVLLRSLTLEPKARLASEDEAKKWLDVVVADYARAKGISLLAPAGSSGSDGGSGGKMIDAALLDKLEERGKSLVRDQMKAFYKYLSENPLDKEGKVKLFEQLLKEKTDELSIWINEHGTDYGNGIKPIFDAKKERRYDSAWNWTRQDCLVLYYDYACGRTRRWNNDIRERLYRIKNRATPNTVDMTEFAKKKAEADGHPEIVSFINILGEILQREIPNYPVYRELSIPMAPHLEVDCKGIIQYREVPRAGVKDMTAYVAEMEKGAAIASSTAEQQETAAGPAGQNDDQMTLLLQQLRAQNADPTIIASMEKLIEENNMKKAEEEERLKKAMQPFIFLRGRAENDPSHRTYEPKLTQKYMNVLREMATLGVTFHDKTILITGCGRDSIGLEIVKAMLRGGAKIYATTSRFSSSGSSFYHRLFDQHGTKTSQLIILPFNQSSQQDVYSLVDYIYDKEGADIDYIIPFAAIPEGGRDIGSIDGKSELAHRLMLTNTIRLIGAVKNKKEARSIVTRPAHVLLPLSPNHGVFGFDGLYAESKLGLEALLNKWHAEGWGGYLSLAGAVIGWTRGTGLMKGNNLLAVGIEQLGVRTFTTQEICFNCVGLLHPKMVAEAQKEPVLADLSGGLLKIKDLGSILNQLRASMNEEASLRKAVYVERKKDDDMENGRSAASNVTATRPIRPRANINVQFPALPSKERLEKLKHIKGMVDLERVVVVTGFGEVGPWGSARTRWEMEAFGEFSIEGCIELAWMMALIRYQNDDSHNGWVDAKTGQPVRDDEIKARYEKVILENTGIRIIEPSLFEGYEPGKKMFLHQVAINEDMGPLEVSSEEEALAFKRQHGDAVQIIEEGGVFQVLIKRGSVLYIPKALKFNRFVAGQIPTTWDPSIFGLPEEIIKQVDPVTLYTLVSTAEALISAGVTDPYEFYEYVHVSQVGNTIGGGFGGMKSVRQMHRDVLLEQPVKGDTLQEMFINTVAAYINMLLLSSSGPIKTPVGACATAVGSIEIGVETIQSGKAKIVLVGGYDDFSEEGSYGFASMKATSNSEAEMEAGRPPAEMSRPATSTRGGFMESQGAGVEILMSADLAIKMGVPIYGIIGHVATATDKNGRSVPAPGKGLLVTARQQNAAIASPMLDISYRRKQLEAELVTIEQWHKSELEFLTQWIKEQASQSNLSEEQEKALAGEQLEILEIKKQHKRSMAYSTWGNEFYRNDPYISPLAGGLAVFGLTIDDVEVASFHGTGTTANDINESQLLQKQLEHLGRMTGNCILSIFQKYLTGHPKGAAAAWMLNGLLQSMMTGIVPGNRNADNIDKELEACDHIVFLNRSLHTYGFKAALLKSFGFGQVGGEILVIHPDYILAQLSMEELEAYGERRQKRYNMAYRHWHDSLTQRKSFVMVKDRAPYTYGEEQKVYLNPKARAKFDGISWSFPETDRRRLYAQKSLSPAPVVPPASPTKGSGNGRSIKSSARTNLEVTLREMGEGLRAPNDRGIGVDTQLISEIEVSLSSSPNFLSRNFTREEVDYCRSTSDPAASFAGRWAAKEAVVKAISSCDDNERSRELWEGGGAALKEIEIVRGPAGAPKVVLHGHAQTVASVLGVGSIKVTISHSGEYAIAQAIAQ